MRKCIKKLMSCVLTLSIAASTVLIGMPAKAESEEIWPKESIASYAVTLQNSGKAFEEKFLRVKNQHNAAERVTFLQFDYSKYDLEKIGQIELSFYLNGNTTGATGQLDVNTAHLYWADYDLRTVDHAAEYDTVFKTSTANEIGDNIIQIPKVKKSNNGDCYSFGVGSAVRASAEKGNTSITFVLKADRITSDVTNYEKCGFDIYGLTDLNYAPRLTFYQKIDEEEPITLLQGGTKLKSGYPVVATDTYGIIDGGADVVFQYSSDGEEWNDVIDDTDMTDNSYLLTNAMANMYVRATVKDGEYNSNSLLVGANLTHPLKWNATPESLVKATSDDDKLMLTIPGYSSVSLVLLDNVDGKSLFMGKPLTSIPYYLDEDNKEASYQIYDPEISNSIAYKINTADFITKNILPEDLQKYILTQEWETEAGIKGGEDAPNDRVTKSKIALLSSTEYNQYASKIGYTDSHGMVLRTPATTASANGGVVEQVTSSGAVQYKDSFAAIYRVRPVFWLSDDFFTNVKVDVVNTGINVLNAISLKEKMTVEKAQSLGYSDIELAMLGMKSGIFFDASQMSKDSQGINVNIDIYNTTAQTPYAQFYLAGYDDSGEKLIYVEKYEQYIENGASCISFTAEVKGVTDENCFMLYAWDEDMKAYADILYNSSYKSIPEKASGSITADSEFFKYTGRWDMSEEEKKIGHWVRPYVEFDVDTDSLVLDFSSKNQHLFRISINDDYVTDIGTTKTAYDISSYLLKGLNTIRITNMANYEPFDFAGVTLGEDSRIARTSDKKIKMLFIGDSITSDKVSYSYQLPFMISADATVVAKSAMALQDGHGKGVISSDAIGMQSQFDVLECVGKGNTVYDYTKDSYDIIVVNIGTNDYITDSTKEDFKTAYSAFISKMHSYYPNAAVVAVKPVRMFAKRENDTANLTGSYWRGIAFDEMNAEGAFDGENTYYCDTTELDVTYISDGVHPDEAGHLQISEFLIKFFKANGIIE